MKERSNNLMISCKTKEERNGTRDVERKRNKEKEERRKPSVDDRKENYRKRRSLNKAE